MNLPQLIQLSQRPPPLGYLIIGGFFLTYGSTELYKTFERILRND